MVRVLFVHGGREMSSFIAQDHDTLAKHFDVTRVPWTGRSSWREVWRGMQTHDCSYSFFLAHHAAAAAFAARLRGKVSIGVAGGEEVASPELLGEPRTLTDRVATSYAFNSSDLVLACSRSILNEARLLRKPRARSEVRLMYYAVDVDRFRPSGPKEDLVATVAVLSESSARRKRLDLFLDAAALLPGVHFVLAGPPVDGTADRLRARATANVAIPGKLSPEELLRLYQRARVYVQPSLHEGFGIANAEAMACGAVSVSADNSALPEVVGDAGFLVDEPVTAEALADAIHHALTSGRGADCRARMVERYPLRRREEALVRAVEDAAARRLKPGLPASFDAPSQSP